MRTILLTFLLSPLMAFGQNTYTAELEAIAKRINEAVTGHNAQTLLVDTFLHRPGNSCDLDLLLTSELEAQLSALKQGYRILDRRSMATIAEEHRLEMNGMVDDEQRVREAARLLKADVLVMGEYHKMNDILLLWVRVTDVQTAEQLVILTGKAREDDILRALCAAAGPANTKPAAVQPQQAGASNSVSPNKDMPGKHPCAKPKKGDHCFTNNSKTALRATVDDGHGMKKVVVVGAGQTACLFDLPVGVYNFYLGTGMAGPHWMGLVQSGSIRVEPCGSSTTTY